MSDQIETSRRYRVDAIPELLEVLQGFLELPERDREVAWPEAEERIRKIQGKWSVPGTAEPPVP